ncbi:MAG TPA: hypothetical protein DCM87_20775 [Planctomycetes bacterium]|nr:hypothetical protein [Planctomycetota bacterium]
MRPKIIRLDGHWYCQFGEPRDAATIGLGDLPSWHMAPVPRPLGEVFALGASWTGAFTYARVFMRPPMTAEHALVLCLAGVRPAAAVYVNGRAAGRAEPWAAFTAVDLTPFVEDGENLLLVVVSDDGAPDVPRPPGGGPLGIWAPAWLEIRPRVHIEAIKVGARLDGSWDAEIRFSAPPAVPLAVHARLVGPNGAIAARADARVEGERAVFAGRRLERALAWDLEFPSMYRLEVAVGGAVPELRAVNVAFRTFEDSGDGFLLNGRPLFVRAVWDDFVFPGWGRTVPSAWALRHRLRVAKELGFNTVVCGGMVPDARVPLLADRLGLLLWYELPAPSVFTPRAAAHLDATLAGALARDGNSPSLALVNLLPDAAPEPSAEALAWARAAAGGMRGGGVVALEGPAAGAAGACAFLGPDAPASEGRTRIAWPIAPAPLPAMHGTLGETLQALGDPGAVFQDLAVAQGEQLLDGIARARGLQRVHAYCVRRLHDGDGDLRGLIDAQGRRRPVADRLHQGDDWVGAVRAPRLCVSLQELEIEAAVSHFSTRDIAGGCVRWEGGGARGECGVPGNERVARLPAVRVRAPACASPRALVLDLSLESAARHRWAQGSFTAWVLPSRAVPWHRVCLDEELAGDGAFAAALSRGGYECVREPSAQAVAVRTRFRRDDTEGFRRGMRALYLIESEDGLPSSAGVGAAPTSGDAFLWVRADSRLFAGLARKWIAGSEFAGLAAPLRFTGIAEKDLHDVLAARLSPGEPFFQPVLFAFRLEHGMGMMTTLPLRRLVLAGDALGLAVLDRIVACLKPGGIPRPRFVPGIVSTRVLVPPSREGSALWCVAFDAPPTSWHRPELDDRGWRRSRGAFGRRGGPGLVLRFTWEQPEIFLRTRFSVDRIPRALVLELFHDRDVQIAINGQVVAAREGFTTGIVTVDLPQDPAEVLHVGENLLAVRCRQPGHSHNLDVGLRAVY